MKKDQFHFDEEGIKPLVLKWKETRDDYLFEDILKRIEKMIVSLVRKRGIYQYMEMDEIIQTINIKIFKGLHLYDPNRLNKKGETSNLFSFLTNVIQNCITQMMMDTAKEPKNETLDIPIYEDQIFIHTDYGYRNSVLDEISIENYIDNHYLEHINYTILNVKSLYTDEDELNAQRWLVKILIDSEFDTDRNCTCDTINILFNIDLDRCKILYDDTLLEIRRAVLLMLGTPSLAISKDAAPLFEDFEG